MAKTRKSAKKASEKSIKPIIKVTEIKKTSPTDADVVVNFHNIQVDPIEVIAAKEISDHLKMEKILTECVEAETPKRKWYFPNWLRKLFNKK